jgi:hypothetical protein
MIWYLYKYIPSLIFYKLLLKGGSTIGSENKYRGDHWFVDLVICICNHEPQVNPCFLPHSQHYTQVFVKSGLQIYSDTCSIKALHPVYRSLQGPHLLNAHMILPSNKPMLHYEGEGLHILTSLCDFSALNASIKSEKSFWTSRCHTKGFKIISKHLWIVTFVLGSQIYIDKCDEIALC